MKLFLTLTRAQVMTIFVSVVCEGHLLNTQRQKYLVLTSELGTLY